MRKIARTLLFGIVLASAAEAQELTAAVSRYGSLGVDDLDGELPLSAEVRVTLPMSERFAFEPFVTVGSQPGRRSGALEGFYGVQIRQRFVRFTSPKAYVFATYGVAAYYSRYESSLPVIGHVGIGLHQRISTHVSFRPELQLVSFHVVPIGVRLVMGLSLN
jgi:hypothetical protein